MHLKLGYIWLGYNNIKEKISEYYFGIFKNYNTQHHCYVINLKSIDHKIFCFLF